jgi:hypothetical protein
MLGMKNSEERARLINSKIKCPCQAADGIMRIITDGQSCCVM